MGVVDLVMGMIDRVRLGERPEDVVQEAGEGDWERRRAAKLYQDYKNGKIEFLSAEETKEFVRDLKKKHNG